MIPLKEFVHERHSEVVGFNPNVYVDSDSKTNIKKIRSREKDILNAWTLFLEYPCIPQSTQPCTLYSLAGAECNKHFGEVLDHAGDNAEFTFK